MAGRNQLWKVQPQAEQWLQAMLTDALARCPDAQLYADSLRQGCGVRLRDIVDHVAGDGTLVTAANDAGWALESDGISENRNGFFPGVLAKQGAQRIGFRVESIDRFLAVTGVTTEIDGAAFAPLRQAVVFNGDGVEFAVVERNGATGYAVESIDANSVRAGRLHQQIFRTRRRHFDTVEAGLIHTEALVDAAVADIGQHRACDLWLRAEREYWMSRCPAGARQKARQDAHGIGWSNIDHHTYDGSRDHFAGTVRILQKLGYELREMLYAGALAGWGSQILEQRALRSTIFADVDLAPEEVDIDFAHSPLPPLGKHRRAGIISVMHGESILEGGLNHVAGMYDNVALRAVLHGEGQKTMAPFSNFPFLYQELTEGDWAAVEPRRLDALEAGGHLNHQEAEDFRLNGAIAAHLENLERNDGYKGFNMPGIDGVLRVIDPRRNMVEAE